MPPIAASAAAGVQRDLAAEQVRRDPAEHQMRVGDGRFGAAPPVAGRARVRAGRPRPDLERALRREPGHRATAGADRHDVDHRDLGRERVRPSPRWSATVAVGDHRDVGRRAAAVAGHAPRGSRPGRRSTAAPERTGRRPGQHGADRLVDDLVRGEHAAVGPHDRERDPPRRRPASASRCAIPETYGATVGFTAASIRVVIARSYSRYSGSTSRTTETHRRRVLAAITSRQPPLVLVVRRRNAGDRLPIEVTPALGQVAHRGDRGILVERPDLVARGVQPAADGAHQVGGHDPRRLHPEVGVAVAVRHRLPGDLQHRLVSRGGDEAE